MLELVTFSIIQETLIEVNILSSFPLLRKPPKVYVHYKFKHIVGP